jgi:hypothetical protein
MNQIVTKTNGNVALAPEIIESLVMNGDLSKMSQPQKLAYYKYRCQQVDLDPSAKPFDLLTLQGKQILYANAGATQQLCERRGLSPVIVGREIIDGTCIVTSRVTDKGGRTTENVGAVPVGGLKGNELANAIMKAVTKAHRRTILAHCGLGMLDETEVETLPNAQPQGRGNPLRQDFAAWNAEIAAAKSQEQLDLIIGSPEFAEFSKACDAQHERGGMHFSDMLRDQAESLKKKLPERIRFEGNKIVATTEAEAEIAADVKPAEDRLSEETARVLDRIDVAETDAELKAISADVKGMTIPDAEKPIINKAYKQRKATIAAKEIA